MRRSSAADGPLAQRAPRLAEHLLGPLQLRVGRTARQRVQAGSGRAHTRAQPGPQPLARLGGQRRAHHAPGLVGLAVDQPAPRGAVGDLADVHAAARRLPAQDLQRRVDRRHDAPGPLALAASRRAAAPASSPPCDGASAGPRWGPRPVPASLITRRVARRRSAGRLRLRAADRRTLRRAPPRRPGRRDGGDAGAVRPASSPPGRRASSPPRRQRSRLPSAALLARRRPLVVTLVVTVDFVRASSGCAGGRDLVIFHGLVVLLVRGRLVARPRAHRSQPAPPRAPRAKARRVQRLVRQCPLRSPRRRPCRPPRRQPRGSPSPAPLPRPRRRRRRPRSSRPGAAALAAAALAAVALAAAAASPRSDLASEVPFALARRVGLRVRLAFRRRDLRDSAAGRRCPA